MEPQDSVGDVARSRKSHYLDKMRATAAGGDGGGVGLSDLYQNEDDMLTAANTKGTSAECMSCLLAIAIINLILIAGSGAFMIYKKVA